MGALSRVEEVIRNSAMSADELISARAHPGHRQAGHRS
jgi:hypothetical protein